MRELGGKGQVVSPRDNHGVQYRYVSTTMATFNVTGPVTALMYTDSSYEIFKAGNLVGQGANLFYDIQIHYPTQRF